MNTLGKKITGAASRLALIGALFSPVQACDGRYPSPNCEPTADAETVLGIAESAADNARTILARTESVLLDPNAVRFPADTPILNEEGDVVSSGLVPDLAMDGPIERTKIVVSGAKAAQCVISDRLEQCVLANVTNLSDKALEHHGQTAVTVQDGILDVSNDGDKSAYDARISATQTAFEDFSGLNAHGSCFAYQGADNLSISDAGEACDDDLLRQNGNTQSVQLPSQVCSGLVDRFWNQIYSIVRSMNQ